MKKTLLIVLIGAITLLSACSSNNTSSGNATNANSSQININTSLSTAVGEFDLNNKLVKLNGGYNMPTSGIGVFGIAPADAEMEQRYTSRVWNFDEQE